MLVPAYEGISQEFRSGAKRWHNVNIRVPIQFFDTPFKAEESVEAREASSALSALRNRGEQVMRSRVPQPYSTRDGRLTGDDLLTEILERVRSPLDHGGKSVQIIVGPAGIGKTVLFESVFARLLGDFLEDKAALRLTPRPRPLPLTPEYLRLSVAPTVKALVEAFLATDFAAPLSRGVFEWMITNGLGIWLLDGLDEVIARDPDFFDYLLELLTLPGGTSPPNIIICVRDSLLATNDDINDFCEEYANTVEIYELAKWKLPSKRRFATMFLRERAKTEGFLDLLQSNSGLDDLSSTPYYCRLLAQQYADGDLKGSYTESQLLADAVSSIIEREYQKDLLDRDLIPETSITEFLEALAAENMEEGFQGITRDAVEEWARILLPSDLAPEDLKKLITHVLQLAVFSEGGVTGNLQFAQEILERYLLGKYLGRRLEGNPAAFVRTLSMREIPAEWATLKVIAEHVREKGKLQELMDLTYQAGPGIAFKNLLQIAALASDDPAAFKDLPLERRDLSGLSFNGLDFHGVSFRACDLTDVEFGGCNLREAVFEDAIIKNTAFLLRGKDDLNGAGFGAMERFYSLRADSGRVIADYAEVRKWIERHTRMAPQILEPCAASRQLRHLFGKFVHPDGTAKRSLLDKRGVLSGKRLFDPGEVLEAAIRYGYLLEEERFGRIKRPDGDAYSEMVAYVKDLRPSAGLKQLLADICKVERCPHVPRA